MAKIIGVLALQGAVTEHLTAIEHAGASGIAIKTPSQLDNIDGLIIPGGESTTIRRLMKQYQFIEPIKALVKQDKGIFGTCAGLVLLASEIEGGEECLGLINCRVRRNGFGRQKESFEAKLAIPVLGNIDFPAVFIRAPLIIQAGADIDVLAYYDNNIVAARSHRILVTSFHPELSQDNRLINYFIDHCLA